MSMNETGLRQALASLAEASKRVAIMEREAIAEAERAENKLNSMRSLTGHIRQFQVEYREQLDAIEKAKEGR